MIECHSRVGTGAANVVPIVHKADTKGVLFGFFDHHFHRACERVLTQPPVAVNHDVVVVILLNSRFCVHVNLIVLHHQVIDHRDPHTLHFLAKKVSCENGVGEGFTLMFRGTPGHDDRLVDLVEVFSRFVFHHGITDYSERLL